MKSEDQNDSEKLVRKDISRPLLVLLIVAISLLSLGLSAYIGFRIAQAVAPPAAGYS